jgi:hypothetical protein
VGALHGSDKENQVLKAAKNLSVVDHAGVRVAAGQMTVAKSAWAFDTSTGAFRQFWPLPPVITSLSVAQTADWRVLTISWAGSGTSSSVTVAGSTIYSGTATSTSYNWFEAGQAPGAALSVTLVMSNAAGSVSGSYQVVAPQFPVPVISSAVAGDDTASLSWSASANAESYQVYGQAMFKVLVGSTTSTSLVVAQAPGSSVSYTVRAVFRNPQGVVRYSAESAVKSVSTPTPTVGAGVYDIVPTVNAVHMAGEAGGSPAGWSTARAALFHGDSGSGDTYGVQTSAWWYGSGFSTAFGAGFASGMGVTRFQVWVRRANGYGGAQRFSSRFHLHPHASVPSASSLGPGLNDYFEGGALGLGEGAWIDLPASWATMLLEGPFKGVAWGNVASRYMAANKSLVPYTDGASTYPANGTLRVTIGAL